MSVSDFIDALQEEASIVYTDEVKAEIASVVRRVQKDQWIHIEHFRTICNKLCDICLFPEYIFSAFEKNGYKMGFYIDSYEIWLNENDYY
jgi:hypothetical protein